MSARNGDFSLEEAKLVGLLAVDSDHHSKGKVLIIERV
jgi:hypothetical protein